MPGTLTGARLFQPLAPETLFWVAWYGAAQATTHKTFRTLLRAWAGSPDWPAVWPWECPVCRGAGEVECALGDEVPPCEHDCPHAEWCCEAQYTCECARGEEPRPGRLLGAVVDRRRLARVLDLPLGPEIGVRVDGPEAPVFLSDGRFRLVLMPLRDVEEDAACPVFEGLQPRQLLQRGAPCP